MAVIIVVTIDFMYVISLYPPSNTIGSYYSLLYTWKLRINTPEITGLGSQLFWLLISSFAIV